MVLVRSVSLVIYESKKTQSKYSEKREDFLKFGGARSFEGETNGGLWFEAMQKRRTGPFSGKIICEITLHLQGIKRESFKVTRE